LWVAAWLVARALGWAEVTAYWAAAKLLVWVVVPVVMARLVWRVPVRAQLEFIGLRRRDLSRGLTWGAGAAVVWVALLAAVAALRGQHFASVAVTGTFVYTVVLTPVFEEWLMRGYVLPGLVSSKLNFWLANALTSLLFLVPHVIGWGFQGVLAANRASGLPLTIFVTSLVLGYVRHRSRSLPASMIVHAANNFASLWWV
ncbi:MAG TPA: CPBP family intramembrane glutamic endopeptidase, partial [Candidatus Saccharimonadia bacterium]|nr:CPBP family intramembrane glutamic endopeptidase [Candidatus Saccharimonadia bacterium]